MCAWISVVSLLGGSFWCVGEGGGDYEADLLSRPHGGMLPQDVRLHQVISESDMHEISVKVYALIRLCTGKQN